MGEQVEIIKWLIDNLVRAKNERKNWNKLNRLQQESLIAESGVYKKFLELILYEDKNNKELIKIGEKAIKVVELNYLCDSKKTTEHEIGRFTKIVINKLKEM